MPVIIERNFSLLFSQNDHFGSHFIHEIYRRDWEYLLHAGNSRYHLGLVGAFFDGFNRSSVDESNRIITLMWQGEYRLITIETISEVTGIPLGLGYSPMNLSDYAPHMGPNLISWMPVTFLESTGKVFFLTIQDVCL